MTVSRSPARPVSGSPVYSPSSRPVYRGGPLGCTITLTNDGLDAFGFAPMSVTGQTVSVTGDGVSDYGMWTGAAGVPVSWTGVRVVEIETKDYTTGEHGFIIATAGIASGLEVSWKAGTGEWSISATGSSVNVSGTALDSMAVGIDGATGDVTVFQNGSQVDTSTLAGLSGMFSGKSAIIIPAVNSLALGDTYSAEIITQSDKYTASYPAGTLDWCGNPIPAFNPVDLPGLLAYYDIRQAGTLFEDTAGVTPVDAATDPIGRWDAVGPSGAPNLTQGTATSRPLYQLTPTRAEFDLLEDSLSVTLPAISGGQIVIVSPAGIWIDGLDFAGGTFTIGPSGYTGGPDGLLSLLSGDVTAVYILDAPLGVDDQAALVAFETARGSAGLITLGANEASPTSWLSPRIADMTTENFVTQQVGSVTAGKKYMIGYTVSGYAGPGGASTVGTTGGVQMLFSPPLSSAAVTQANNFSVSLLANCTTSGTYNIVTRGPANSAGANEALFSGITIREVILP